MTEALIAAGVSAPLAVVGQPADAHADLHARPGIPVLVERLGPTRLPYRGGWSAPHVSSIGRAAAISRSAARRLTMMPIVAAIQTTY